jgi:septin family protein
MFVYEPYRKRALELDNNKKEEQEEPPIQRGRIKKTQRVIRMFQVTHTSIRKKRVLNFYCILDPFRREQVKEIKVYNSSN